MTDHEFFIYGSYGVTALALLIELVWLRISAARSLAALRETRQMGDA